MKLKQHELIALCLRIQSEKPQIEKDLELGVTLATLAETYKAPLGALKNAFTACGISWEKKRAPTAEPLRPVVTQLLNTVIQLAEAAGLSTAELKQHEEEQLKLL